MRETLPIAEPVPFVDAHRDGVPTNVEYVPKASFERHIKNEERDRKTIIVLLTLCFLLLLYVAFRVS